MAVIPISIARVSQNLRAFNLLASVRKNTTDLFGVQNQIATGLKVMTPSDDPMLAAAASAADRRLDLINQVERNLVHVNNALTQVETAMNDAVQLVMDVQTIASETVGDTSSPEERASLARVVDSVLDQLVAVGNRRYLNFHLFGGFFGQGQPFELIGEGVMYNGDDGTPQSIVDTDLTEDTFAVPGSDFFEAFSTEVRGAVDLDPALTRDTRVSDLRGTTGQGVELGQVVVDDGATEVTIDLANADTVGDILDKLNDELPASLRATMTTRGIQIESALGGPAQITVQDVASTNTARDLGIAGSVVGLALGNVDLDPKLTQRSRIADLMGGAGLNLGGGITINNGPASATISFANAQTIEDVLNLMNHADVRVDARIGDDGRTIEVRNRVSGSDLTIAENGGQAATNLGIRSLYGGTSLNQLNDGKGIETVNGADIRFVTADGTTVDVDLSGAETFQDVIDRINAQGGASLSAALAATGNGLVVTDNTVGPNTLRVERANLSPALDGLGLDAQAAGNTLTGRDINPVRTDNIFTALVELRDALRSDDRQGIAKAGNRLEDALIRMQEVQGQMASHARAMQERNNLVESEVLAAQILLSDVRDVDMADAIVRFQQMQTALQANLTTSSRVMNLSLVDFLG